MNCEIGNVCSYTNKVPSYKGLGLLSLLLIGEQISQHAGYSPVDRVSEVPTI
jgi:hypothetical protein